AQGSVRAAGSRSAHAPHRPVRHRPERGEDRVLRIARGRGDRAPGAERGRRSRAPVARPVRRARRFMTEPAVVGLDAAGTPEAWAAAGFAVVDGVVTIGHVAVRIGVGEKGIAAWTLAGVPEVADVDGLPTRVED